MFRLPTGDETEIGTNAQTDIQAKNENMGSQGFENPYLKTKFENN